MLFTDKPVSEKTHITGGSGIKTPTHLSVDQLHRHCGPNRECEFNKCDHSSTLTLDRTYSSQFLSLHFSSLMQKCFAS